MVPRECVHPSLQAGLENSATVRSSGPLLLSLPQTSAQECREKTVFSRLFGRRAKLESTASLTGFLTPKTVPHNLSLRGHGLLSLQISSNVIPSEKSQIL